MSPDAILTVKHLDVRHGPGCAVCTPTPPDDTVVCPNCGSVLACRDVTFEVFPGEAVGIVGESGSGKSTTLSTIALDTDPVEGSIHLAGRELRGLRGAARRTVRTEQIGVVHQRAEDGLTLDVSAGGNIASGLMARGNRSFDDLHSQAGMMHSAVELDAVRLDDAVRGFSGGMRQRVQLARALVNHPQLLLLDEPTTGLDVSVQATILDLIRRIRREQQLAMLLVSHDLAVIRMLADRVLVMRRGRVVESGLTDQVLSDPQHPYTQLLVSSQLT